MSGSNGLTITAANAVILLVVPGVYSVPQQLQGFAAEDVYSSDDVEPGEVVLGVDGKLSAGYAPYTVSQLFSIMPDSPSSTVFENWLLVESALKDKFYAQGTTALPSTNRSYVMTNGVLTRAKILPDAGKVLKARQFRITWESVTPAPIP